MPNLDEHMAAEAVTRAEHPTVPGEPPASFRRKQAWVFIAGIGALVAIGFAISLVR